MKVDYNRPAYSTSGTYGIDGSAAKTQGTQASSGMTSSDAVSISGDVELAAKALAAANATPDIRPDAVARGQALLKNGIDLETLSDAMLNAWRME